MVAGASQTNSAGFRIPAGKTGYMVKLTGKILGNNSNSWLDGTIWVRTNGGSPRLRRPFAMTQNEGLNDTIYGGLVFSEKTDIHLRITAASATGLTVAAGYDIIMVDN